MKQFDILLAKSWNPTKPGEQPPTYTRLVPHLRAVERAGISIVEAAGELILQQIDLPIEPWLSRLERAVRVACLCHDIGKANESFQSMVRKDLDPRRQPARHELLSALLLEDENSSVRAWARKLLDQNLYDDGEWLLNCVIGAISGHHVKIDEDWKRAVLALQGGCDASLNLLLTHPDLGYLFKQDKPSQEMTFSLVNGRSGFIGSRRMPFNFRSSQWSDKLRSEPQWWRFAAVVKALTCAADVAGSAMLPEKEPIRRWITQTLGNRVTEAQLCEVVTERLKGLPPRLFQQQIGQSTKRVTLVEAGCGSGKTVAAYLWAAHHAHGKKLFFCYPTTGTATEGFLGYVQESDVEAKLMHSRAIADLEGIAEVNDEDDDDHLLRIESLSAWSPQVIICTADTVLSLVRNNRRGLYNSPAILSGVFVFDELHAYDDTMFAAVLALIRVMPGASFLLMSASLPKWRRRILFSEIGDIEQIATPKDLEDIMRYEFHWADSQDFVFANVKEAVSQNKKILWVCNTVAQAQAILSRASEQGIIATTYHSRFKYQDRKQRHRSIVDSFSSHVEAGLLAVTTQVAEMSLDLDADILISEVAPIPALVQRLGRLNRRVTPDNPGKPRPAYFLKPKSVLPYHKVELDTARQWIDALQQLGRPLSQSDLAEQFHTLSPDKECALDLRSEWLDSGWQAQPGPIREGRCAVSVILPEDEAACRESNVNIINRRIPMNFDSGRGMETWREFKGNLIAPRGVIQYDKEIGATWQKE